MFGKVAEETLMSVCSSGYNGLDDTTTTKDASSSALGFRGLYLLFEVRTPVEQTCFRRPLRSTLSRDYSSMVL
jgi:hypothetical protein